MPLQATSGAASYDAFGGGVPVVPAYIEEVFSTTLYTGTGALNTITNGIDLSTKGGLVWCKGRNFAGYNNSLMSTAFSGMLFSDATNAASDYPTDINSYNNNGFTLKASTNYDNISGTNYASWTFRKQPKFFDVVTYTGNGTTGKVVNHSLGSEPACILVKLTSSAGSDWQVWHRNDGTTAKIGYLNLTSSMSNADYSSSPNLTFLRYAPTSTDFTLKASTQADASACNASGQTYVAYLFAHDAGGFGLTGTDNVISCGSFTTDGSGNATVTLGYEPQFWLEKRSDNTSNWNMFDSMRGMNYSDDLTLKANTSDAEVSQGTSIAAPTATGMAIQNRGASQTWIYIAIRRGPMKVPTVGTSVFSPSTRAGTGASVTTSNLSFPPDMVWSKGRDNGGTNSGDFDRLRGATKQLSLNQSDSETTASTSLTGFDVMTGYRAGDDAVQLTINATGYNYANWNFRRAPGFFDEVCYTGNSVTPRTITHNLGVAPELMLIKSRSNARGWAVYASAIGNNKYLILNGTNAALTDTTMWVNTAPTSSVFTVGDPFDVNNTAYTYVAYLFATCAGVSKVGSYTGTGTTLQVDCGFTGGARFVLIKRTDSTGDWYVWDSARGIVSGNDPYLLLNSTAAEVTGTDYVDTYSAGFEISSTAPAAINASAGSFIFLAIA